MRTQRPEWAELCDRQSEHGFESLSEPEKHWVVIRQLIDATANGGLISYFYNPGADRLQLCLAALDELNATRVKGLLLRQCSFFGDVVPTDLDERNLIINSWKEGEYDTELDEIDLQIMPLLEDLDLRLDNYLKEQGYLN